MTTRDRKDVPQPNEAARLPQPETHTDRVERKKKESDALDKALEETFPTSDPISPFVPAIPSEPATAQAVAARSVKCAHAGCTCSVTPPELWCCESCRSSQQGYMDARSGQCPCEHAGCEHTGA